MRKSTFCVLQVITRTVCNDEREISDVRRNDILSVVETFFHVEVADITHSKGLPSPANDGVVCIYNSATGITVCNYGYYLTTRIM